MRSSLQVKRARARQCSRNTRLRRPCSKRLVIVRSWEQSFIKDGQLSPDTAGLDVAKLDPTQMSSEEIADLLARHLRGEEDSSDTLMFRKHGVRAEPLFHGATAGVREGELVAEEEFIDVNGREIYAVEDSDVTEDKKKDPYGMEDESSPWKMFEEGDSGDGGGDDVQWSLEEEIKDIEEKHSSDEKEVADDIESDYDPAHEAYVSIIDSLQYAPPQCLARCAVLHRCSELSESKSCCIALPPIMRTSR